MERIIRSSSESPDISQVYVVLPSCSVVSGVIQSVEGELKGGRLVCAAVGKSFSPMQGVGLSSDVAVWGLHILL